MVWIVFTDEDPPVNPDFRKRAVRSLKEAIPAGILEGKEEEEEEAITAKCYSCCCTTDQCRCLDRCLPPLLNPPQLHLSLEMKAARRGGFKVTKNMFIPTLPKFVTIIWVLLELLITITQFIFSIVTIELDRNMEFNIVYLVLASINLILASIDAFLFFLSFERVQNIFKHCWKKLRHQDDHHLNRNASTDENELVGRPRKCCGCKDWRKTLAQWMELIRNLLSELLLYPLVVCDLFELIVNGTYNFQAVEDRVSFSYFIFGLFFLTVSVYIARLLIVIFAMRTLNRTPRDFSKVGNDTVQVVMRFFFHVIIQLVIHMMCIIAVAAKIAQENPNATGMVSVSPTLWVVLFTGWLIPIVGTVMFFPINYFWIEQFSTGMYMNIVGLLQEKSFAEAVFTTQKYEDVKKSCAKFFEKIKYIELQQQMELRQSVGTLHRFLYPLRTPVFYIITPIYCLMLGGFIISLMLTSSPDGSVSFSLFDGGNLGIAIVLCIIFTVFANFQVVLLAGLLLLLVLLVPALPIILLGAVAVRLYKRSHIN